MMAKLSRRLSRSKSRSVIRTLGDQEVQLPKLDYKGVILRFPIEVVRHNAQLLKINYE